MMNLADRGRKRRSQRRRVIDLVPANGDVRIGTKRRAQWSIASTTPASPEEVRAMPFVVPAPRGPCSAKDRCGWRARTPCIGSGFVIKEPALHRLSIERQHAHELADAGDARLGRRAAASTRLPYRRFQERLRSVVSSTRCESSRSARPPRAALAQQSHERCRRGSLGSASGRARWTIASEQPPGCLYCLGVGGRLNPQARQRLRSQQRPHVPGTTCCITRTRRDE